MFVGLIALVSDAKSPLLPSGSEIPVFLSLLSASLLTVWGYQYSKQSQKKPPPGPWGFPVLGHLPRLKGGPQVAFREWARQYGDVFQIYMGSRRTVVVGGVETVRKVLVHQSEEFAGRPDFMSFRSLGDGNSMTFGPFGERAKLHKRVARSALRMFVQHPEYPIEDSILHETDTLVQEILVSAGEPQCIQNNIFMAAGSVIFGMCFGAKKTLREEEDFAVFMQSQKVFQENQKAGGNPADLFPLLEPFMKSRLNDFNKVIKQMGDRLTAIQQQHLPDFHPDHLRDITDCLINAANELTEDEKQKTNITRDQIMRTVNDLIGAGLGTVQVTINWAVLYLIEYPQIQTQLQAHIDDVLGASAPKPGDRRRLPRVESFLHEVLRRETIVPFLLPHCTTTDTTLNGYDIPKDTMVFVDMLSTCKDPRVWDRPDEFDPDRFINEDGSMNKSKAEDAFVFGGGYRRCVGEQLARTETFLMLTRLLQRCRFEKVPGDAYTFDVDFMLTRDPKPYRLIVTPRG